jgi:predicted Zn-dependent peptidase
MYNMTYDTETSKEEIMTAIDEVMVNLKEDITEEMLAGALVKMRSQLYDDLGGTFGLGRADLLCSFALFDDDPSRINTIEDEFKTVTPELVRSTIDQYLRKGNRNILTINPLLANNQKTQ